MIANWPRSEMNTKQKEIELLKALGEALELDPQPKRLGVLLAEDIKYYSEEHKLISPFLPYRLKPAAYELSVGDECYIGGKYKKLTDDDPTIKLEPFEVAVIKTAETLFMPRFMIARWNIRVKWAYKGLLWVGGPQVDPGYKGHLFCPLYNLSDKPVRIDKGEEIAVIDFVKTAHFDPAPKEKWRRYRSLPSRPTIKDFGVEDFRSALSTQAAEKIDEIEQTLNLQTNRFLTFVTITFLILAILVSAISITIFGGPGEIAEEPTWIQLPIWFAVLVIAFSGFSVSLSALTLFQRARELTGRRVWWSVLMALIVAVVFLFVFTLVFIDVRMPWQ